MKFARCYRVGFFINIRFLEYFKDGQCLNTAHSYQNSNRIAITKSRKEISSSKSLIFNFMSKYSKSEASLLAVIFHRTPGVDVRASTSIFYFFKFKSSHYETVLNLSIYFIIRLFHSYCVEYSDDINREDKYLSKIRYVYLFSVKIIVIEFWRD